MWNNSEVLAAPAQVMQYLRTQNIIRPQEVATIESLPGGVSSSVWKITGREQRLVLKQALAKLKVHTDWYSDVERIAREVAAMRFLEPKLPPGSLPRIVFEDAGEHLYVMTCAPEGVRPWKSLLLEGRFEPEVARQAGALLRMLHTSSRDITDEQRSLFQNLQYFVQLRIDPFYTFLKDKYPELEPQIEQLERELTEDGQCLVHGDFSPKNMLIDNDNRIMLLDYEAAHWGNPVFDVAFLITHLLLKGLGFGRGDDSFALVRAFLKAYGEDPARLLPHIGLLLLARIDGKSQVEYIESESVKETIRELAVSWLLGSSSIDPVVAIGQALRGGKAGDE